MTALPPVHTLTVDFSHNDDKGFAMTEHAFTTALIHIRTRAVAAAGAVFLLTAPANAAGGDVLAISVTKTPDPVRATDALTFTGSVANVSSSTVGSFTLFATVPAFTSARLDESPGASCVENPGGQVCSAGQTLRWLVGSLTTGATATRAFSVRLDQQALPPVGTALATAFSTSVTSGSIGRSAAFGGVAANLAVDAPPFTVGANETTRFFVTASNVGDASQTNTLQLQLPPGVSIDSASDGGVLGAGTVTWPLTNRAPGAVDRVSATVTTGALSSGSLLVADANLVSDGAGISLANARAVLAVNSALEVAVTPALDVIGPDQAAVFTIVVANPTSSTISSFDLFATVPNGTTVLGAEDDLATCGGSASGDCLSGQTLAWLVGNLSPGETEALSFTARTNGALADGTQLTTVVTTDFASGSAATGTVVVGPPGPNVLVDAAPGSAAAGSTNRIRVTATNTDSAARVVDLVVDVPVDALPVIVSDGGTAVDQAVTWPAIALPPGGIVQRFVDVQTDIAPQNEIQMIQARLRDTANGTAASRSRAFLATNDILQKTVSVSPSPALPGQPVVYAITVANNGSSTISSFDLRARVPQGTTVPGEQDQGAVCEGLGASASCNPGQTLVWLVGNLSPGNSATRSFTALVDDVTPPPPGTLLATVVTSEVDSGAAVSGHAVLARDTDADLVFDFQDNCTLLDNPDQRDTDGDGYGNLCDADLNNDGIVNIIDLGLLRLAFFSAGPDLDADFNGDGVVNVIDLGLMRTRFFQAPGPGQPGDSQL